MSNLEADLRRALSMSGAVNIVLDGRGKWQVSARTKKLDAWSVEVRDDPFEAITKVASLISDDDLPSFDLFEAAARRRDGSDGFNASVDRAFTPKPLAKPVGAQPTLFDDLLGD